MCLERAIPVFTFPEFLLGIFERFISFGVVMDF